MPVPANPITHRPPHVRMLFRAELHTVRLKMIGDAIIKNVGKSVSCMVSKLPSIFKRTRTCRRASSHTQSIRERIRVRVHFIIGH